MSYENVVLHDICIQAHTWFCMSYDMYHCMIFIQAHIWFCLSYDMYYCMMFIQAHNWFCMF